MFNYLIAFFDFKVCSFQLSFEYKQILYLMLIFLILNFFLPLFFRLDQKPLPVWCRRVAFDATANVWSAMDQTTSTPVSSVDITDRRENAFQIVLLITTSASIKAVESTVACPVTPVVSSVPIQHHSIVYCAKSTWCTWILMLEAKW